MGKILLIVVFWGAFAGLLAAVRRQRVFWPLVALGLLLLFNHLFTPGFFDVEVRDGRFYGTLVDILNYGGPVILLALGMTLVIATGGVVIGGTLLTGRVRFVPGTLMGVLILGLIQTLITFQGNLNSWWTKIAIGVLLLLFIVLQKGIGRIRRA